MEHFDELMRQPEAVDDPMLAAVAQACSASLEDTDAWGQRLTELTMTGATKMVGQFPKLLNRPGPNGWYIAHQRTVSRFHHQPTIDHWIPWKRQHERPILVGSSRYSRT